MFCVRAPECSERDPVFWAHSGAGVAPPRFRRLAAAAALLAIVAAACGGRAAADVTFRTSDGFTLEGRLFGHGAKAVILAHMFESDQSSWSGFASDLSRQGYAVLTFNFRGYGKSQGSKDIASMDRDVSGAIKFMSETHGAERIVLIGASMGGTASLIAADRAELPVATLSAPVSFRGLDAGDHVAGIGAPKLFIAADGDSAASKSARELFRRAADPEAGLELLIGNAHGTALLDSKQSDKVAALLKNFISRNTK